MENQAQNKSDLYLLHKIHIDISMKVNSGLLYLL